MLETLGVTSVDLQFVGLVAGGIWAVFLLIALRKRQQAAADLAIKEAQLREIELNAKRFAAVSVTIDAAIHQAEPKGPYILTASITLANQGSRNTRIEWHGEAAPFVVRRCDFMPDGTMTYRTVAERFVVQTLNPDIRLRSHYVRIGAREQLSFAIRIDEPGLYLLSFRAPTDPAERQETGSTLPAAWTARKLVFVEFTPPGFMPAGFMPPAASAAGTPAAAGRQSRQ